MASLRRAGSPIRVPAHRATTASLQAAYPFLNGPGLGSRGSYIGQNCYGGAFCFDPFELYAAGVLTNPNLLVVGAVGS
ncbi:MAG TPA: ATP-binding protein, partial [Nonomuraea sp.]|nr:ATP-binding protein [Nonomuraea sp.]